MNLCDIAILSIKNADYFYVITGITKSEAVKPWSDWKSET